MKKSYKELQINVISLDDADVITASGYSGSANKGDFGDLLGGNFDIDGLSKQSFS